jgi:glycosyltransferase involved in cell wall biosynthesis
MVSTLTRPVVDAETAPHIHVWCPDMFGSRGGIGVFSSFLLSAIRDIYPGGRYEVFLKNDKRWEANGTNHARFHFSGGWPLSLRTPAYAANLLSNGIARRPRLIIATHLHFSPAARWLKKTAGVPYWVVAHGVEAWGVESQRLKAAMRDADKILAVSNYTRDRLLTEQEVSPENISLLPNTFNERRFKIGPKPDRLMRRYNLRPDQPVLLTVSRLVSSEKYKGYDRVLRALPELRAAIRGLHYIIVGKGDDRARIEWLIAELGLSDCVTLAGFIPDDELCDYYNLCDVFAMPSKREGFGIVYLEAMACGKPTLGGNKDGAIDALCGGELGALVDPDDQDQLAHTLVQLLRGVYPRPLIYQPEKLRERVIEKFGYENFRRTLGGHLREFLKTSVARHEAA